MIGIILCIIGLAALFLWEYLDKSDLDKKDTAIGMLDASTVEANNNARAKIKAKLLRKINKLREEDPSKDYRIEGRQIIEKEPWMIQIEHKIEELNAPFQDWQLYPRYVIQQDEIRIISEEEWRHLNIQEKIWRHNSLPFEERGRGYIIFDKSSGQVIDQVTKELVDTDELPPIFEYPRNTAYKAYQPHLEDISRPAHLHRKIKF